MKTVKRKIPILEQKPITPYMAFVQAERSSVFSKNPSLSVKDIVAHLSTLWQQLSKEERRPYIELAIVDQARFEQNQSISGPPKKPMNPYMLFAQDQRENVKQANPGLAIRDIVRQLGLLWKQLSNEQKQPYEGKAEEAKAAHEIERQKWLNQCTEMGVSPKKAKQQSKEQAKFRAGKKPKAKELLPKPKRAQPAFMFFSVANRTRVSQTNHEWKLGDVSKELGRLWQGMTDEEKAPYFVLHEQDKERHRGDVERNQAILLKNKFAKKQPSAKKLAKQQKMALDLQQQQQQQHHRLHQPHQHQHQHQNQHQFHQIDQQYQHHLHNNSQPQLHQEQLHLSLHPNNIPSFFTDSAHHRPLSTGSDSLPLPQTISSSASRSSINSSHYQNMNRNISTVASSSSTNPTTGPTPPTAPWRNGNSTTKTNINGISLTSAPQPLNLSTSPSSTLNSSTTSMPPCDMGSSMDQSVSSPLSEDSCSPSSSSSPSQQQQHHQPHQQHRGGMVTAFSPTSHSREMHMYSTQDLQSFHRGVSGNHLYRQNPSCSQNINDNNSKNDNVANTNTNTDNHNSLGRRQSQTLTNQHPTLFPRTIAHIQKMPLSTTSSRSTSTQPSSSTDTDMTE